MNIVKKLLSALMYIVYILALSYAAFGSGKTDPMIKSKAQLTNPHIFRRIVDLHRKCSHPHHEIEVLVDRKGFISDHKWFACNDDEFKKEVTSQLKYLVFIPAFSIADQAVPSTVILKLDTGPELLFSHR